MSLVPPTPGRVDLSPLPGPTSLVRNDFAIVLLAMLLTLAGCTSGRVVDLQQNDQPVQVPGRDDPLVDATLAHVRGQWSRAMSEMDRTSRATEWSLMGIQRHPPARSKAHPTPPDWFSARSLMTNGGIAQIICWAEKDDIIAVAVRAGLFGNKTAEARFLRNLAANLAKPPVPDRSMTFDMPTLKDYQRDDQVGNDESEPR